MRKSLATRLHSNQALSKGALLELSTEEHHFLKHVLRLMHGDRIAVFNNRDGEFTALIKELNKKQGVLKLEALRQAPYPEPDVWLCFAPIKKTPIDFIAQKATELGVQRLVPVLTQHTAVTRLNLNRLAANAKEAAEQTGRLSIPDIAPALTLPDLLAGWPPERLLIVADETGAGQPIGKALPALKALPAGLVIGPEGGFAASELDAMRKLPQYRGVSLGKRLLRADTAALAALACWQAMAGDWGEI